MPIYIYRSTDTSAPVLNGVAGSLINVLDACLVNGYGSNESLGQTKSFNGTNLAVYRPSSGSRMYLAIDDTGTTGARVRIFEDISSAWASAMNNPLIQCNGICAVPTEIQLAGGLYMYKSSAASSTARPQVLISNGTIFYLWVDANSDGGSASRVLCFGDIYSYYSKDSNPCILIASKTASYYNFFSSVSPVTTNLDDHYLVRKYDGLNASIACGKTGLLSCSGSFLTRIIMGYSAGYNVYYPDPIIGGMIMTPVIVYEVYNSVGSVIRGRMPGLQFPCHPYPFVTGDIITGGVGTNVDGRTFETFRAVNYSDNQTGCFFIETSDTQDIENFR